MASVWQGIKQLLLGGAGGRGSSSGGGGPTPPPSLPLLIDSLFDPIAHYSAQCLGTHWGAFQRSVFAVAYGSLSDRAITFLGRELQQGAAGTPQSATYPPAAPLPSTLEGCISATSSIPVPLASFVKLGVVGQGSYGSVYVWRHRLSGQLFSVKECSKHILKAKGSVHTSIREVSCSLAVSGSPFCEGYAWVAQSETHIYFAQCFKARGDLERWLLGVPGRRFEESVARFYCAQLVLALRAIHGMGLVHRDVKASNVLVDASGALSLTDWGLSVFLHRCSTASPDYARPCRGGKVR